MGRTYEIAGRGDSRVLEAFLAKEGQFLLPMVQLIEEAELAVDELIDVMGRATIQAVLQMSAEQVVGPKRRGKRDETRSVHWYGSQPGVVSLSNRKLRVRRPRLREKGRGEGGEVGVPAYQAMRSDRRLGERMLEILLAGVSTRKYGVVVPEMAETVGISKSSVSRETIEAGERKLRELTERRFDDRDILIIYLDGIELGSYHVIAAVGVDTEGHKHVLGLREGASENATGAAGGAGGARCEARPSPPVRDRRLEGAAQGDRPGVRFGESGAALSQSQATERAEASTQGGARPGALSDAGGLQAGGGGGEEAVGAAGLLAPARASLGGGESAGGVGGDVYHQPTRSSCFATSLPGKHEPDRLHPLGRAGTNASRDELAKRRDGDALGCGGVPRHREELPTDPGLPPALDSQSSSR